MELVEEPESDSADEESLSEELDETSTFFASTASSGPNDESESDEVSGELEAEDDCSFELMAAVVFAFLAFGASSSELEAESESYEEELLEAALRFRLLAFGFGAAALTAGLSLSSSASLSLSEVESVFAVVCESTIAGAVEASTISTSLSSSSLLSEPRSLRQHDYNTPRSMILIRTRVATATATGALFLARLRLCLFPDTSLNGGLVLFLLQMAPLIVYSGQGWHTF